MSKPMSKDDRAQFPEGGMKRMTISEAVDVLRRAGRHWNMDGVPQALATLEDVRLCEESEAREVISRFCEELPDHIDEALINPARRWLAEHGGE